jgi:catechol 2,3-dioxygenase-like lactoylglutathione lyase family enzyme
MPSVLGVHHIRLPVMDIDASSDWYRTIFGFEILLYEEEEAGAVGAVLRHPSGVVLGLHQVEVAVVAALEGFNVLGLTADDLSAWVDELDRLGAVHGEVTRSSVGYFIEVMDPNGTVVQLHTAEQPNVEEG